MPTPIAIAGLPAAFHRRLSRLERLLHASAASHARAAWSGISTGAPQTAMTASPMYLSSVPPDSSTSSVIGVRYSPRNPASASGAHALGERREAADVGEQHGELAPLAAEPRARGLGEDAIDHACFDVLREHRAQVGLLAALGGEPADHRRDQDDRGGSAGAPTVRIVPCANVTWAIAM